MGRPSAAKRYIGKHADSRSVVLWKRVQQENAVEEYVPVEGLAFALNTCRVCRLKGHSAVSCKQLQTEMRHERMMVGPKRRK